MTRPSNPAARVGIDPASGPDKTGTTLFLPHEGRRNCAYTVLLDDQIKLYRLGLLPVRCRTCGDLFRDVEGA